MSGSAGATRRSPRRRPPVRLGGRRSRARAALPLLAMVLAVFGAAAPALAQAPPLQAPVPQPAGSPAAGGPPPLLAPDTSASGAGEQAARPTEAAEPEELKLDSRVIPLGGALKSTEVWDAFRARFVTDQGRVIDTGNGGISHSEGQGYAMVAAVAARDRVAFDRIWGWTRANLMVRDDKLLAWRWDPDKRPGVGDINNATDGDILIAWALAEAGELWNSLGYRTEARRIAVEVGRKTILFKTRWGALLLPSIFGFAAESRPDGPVVNVSYWVFPAFQRLPLVAPEIDWAGLSRSGVELIAKGRFGPSQLPIEWMSARGEPLKPADGFPESFGYNAIRVPLYLAWAGLGDRYTYAPFVSLWANRDRPVSAIDTASGRATQGLSESGYNAIVALTFCAVNGAKVPRDFVRLQANENYYPAMLHLLSIIAVQMRYPSCLSG